MELECAYIDFFIIAVLSFECVAGIVVIAVPRRARGNDICKPVRIRMHVNQDKLTNIIYRYIIKCSQIWQVVLCYPESHVCCAHENITPGLSISLWTLLQYKYTRSIVADGDRYTGHCNIKLYSNELTHGWPCS